MRSTLAIVLLATILPGSVPAAVRPVAITGTPSPLGLPFSAFRDVTLLGDGGVTFVGSSTGVFRRAGSLVRVIAAGDVLPDGSTVAGLSAPALGPGGCVATRAILIGGGGRILRRCGAFIEVVAARGTAIDGGSVVVEPVGDVAYGAGGEIAFGAILDDGSTGLLIWSEGTLVSAVRTGSSGPTGGAFTALRLVGLTFDGRLGFRGAIANGRDGLFMGDGGRLRRVVEVGEASPIGGTFETVGGASMNDAGQWAFRGSLSRSGRAGVFRADTTFAISDIAPVALEGDQVIEPTISIRTLPSSLTPALNAAGVVVFRATLRGAEESGSAIFLVRPNERPQRVLGARDEIVDGSLVRLRDPLIGADESVLVPASIAGGGPGLFVHRAGAITTLARVGEATDIDAGQERFRFAQPSVRGPVEDAVFLGSREGVFVSRPDGAFDMLAFVGGPGPAALGGTFTGFDPPAANDAGTIAFGAEIQGSEEVSRALVVNGPRGLRVAARSLQPVRGGRLVDFFVGTIDPLARGDVGPRDEIAFEGTMQGGRIPRALLVQRNGRPQPVVKASKRAPGGGEFEAFGTPALFRGGMAFVARVDDATARPKLYVRRGTRTRALAAGGGGVPGRLGGRFEDFDPPDANDSLVAFRATTDRPGNEGLFVTSGRRVRLLVGTNDPAPGGELFRGFSAPSLGQTRAYFLARLVGTATSQALYATQTRGMSDPDAPPPVVDTILRPGDPSPLGGQVSQIEAFSANGRDAVAALVDLIGASAGSAVLVID